MPLFPINFFTERPTTDISTEAGDIKTAVSDSKAAVLELLDSLHVGDTLLGKVTNQSGKNLSIVTSEGVNINAKNSALVSFDKGANILFEVTQKSGKNLSIRPLYQNTTVQKTAEVALRQAGLPINSRSLEMTGRNMEYGNPIDRQALIESYKDVALFPNASVRCIVDLQKMEIPVNDASIRQYNAYLNMENSVVSAFSEITDKIFDSVLEEFSVPSLNTEATEPLPDLNGLLNAISDDTMAESAEEAPAPKVLVNNALDLLESVTDKLAPKDGTVSLFLSGEDITEVLKDAEDLGLRMSVDTASLENVNFEESKVSPFDFIKGLISELRNPEIMESIPELNENQSANANNNTVLAEQPDVSLDAFSKVIEFVNKESVRNLFKKVVSSQWSLNVENLGDKAELSKLYERLITQSKDIANTLSEANSKNSPAVNESINNLNENLNFMSDINHYVPYIQIPFHSNGNMNNSELYVYTNRKNMAHSDGEISAFIHLDMDNLGPTDVLVKMYGEKVSTNFTVKDEDTLIFLEHHMDFLKNRLDAKGYSFDCKVSAGKNDKSPMEQMLYETGTHLVLQDTSFDARV